MAPASASCPPLECVHLCVSLSPTCPSCVVPICSFLSSVWIPKFSQGKRQEDEGRDGKGRRDVKGGWAEPETEEVEVGLVVLVGEVWPSGRPPPP